MRVVKQNAWLTGLAVALVTALGSGASAQSSDLATNPVSTDRSGSIVVFPKVIADGTRDTLIELTNTSNQTAYAHCVYVNGTGRCSMTNAICTAGGNPTASECTGGPPDVCVQACEALDFRIVLTRQQPTIWRVSTGRSLNPLDNDQEGFCDGADCPGIDPAGEAGGLAVPPPPGGGIFQGELKCVQTDSSFTPTNANSLKGEAVLETVSTGQVSRYNSLNFYGSPARNDGSRGPNDGDEIFHLNGDEYSRCPAAIEFIHHANGAVNDVAESVGPGSCTSGCTVRTEITLVPCTQYPEVGPLVEAAIGLDTINEFENQTGSSRFTIGCWANLGLSQIDAGIFAPANGQYRKTRLGTASTQNVCHGSLQGVCVGGSNAGNPCSTSAECDLRCAAAPCMSDADCGSGICGPATGFLAVVEEFYDSDNDTSSAAQNVHMIGQRAGVCQNNVSTPCESDCDCNAAGNCDGSGRCIVDSVGFESLPN